MAYRIAVLQKQVQKGLIVHYVLKKHPDGDTSVLFAGSRDKAIAYYHGYVDAIQQESNYKPDFRTGYIESPEIDRKIAYVYLAHKVDPLLNFQVWVTKVDLPHAYTYFRK